MPVRMWDAEDREALLALDELGGLTEMTDPLGRKRTMGYDEVGNLVSQVDGAESHRRNTLARAVGGDARAPGGWAAAPRRSPRSCRERLEFRVGRWTGAQSW